MIQYTYLKYTWHFGEDARLGDICLSKPKSAKEEMGREKVKIDF